MLIVLVLEMIGMENKIKRESSHIVFFNLLVISLGKSLWQSIFRPML